MKTTRDLLPAKKLLVVSIAAIALLFVVILILIMRHQRLRRSTAVSQALPTLAQEDELSEHGSNTQESGPCDVRACGGAKKSEKPPMASHQHGSRPEGALLVQVVRAVGSAGRKSCPR